MVGLLVLFLLVEALGIPLLSDPSPWMKRGGPVVALAGTLLPTVDVRLPVPSNVVMLANGALFGVVIGTLLSLLWSMGATAIGLREGALTFGVVVVAAAALGLVARQIEARRAAA